MKHGHPTLSNSSGGKILCSGSVLDGIGVSRPWDSARHLGRSQADFNSPCCIPWFSRATFLALGGRRGCRVVGMSSRALVSVAKMWPVLSGDRSLAIGNVARLGSGRLIHSAFHCQQPAFPASYARSNLICISASRTAPACRTHYRNHWRILRGSTVSCFSDDRFCQGRLWKNDPGGRTGPGVRLGPRGIPQSRLCSLARTHAADRFDGHDVGNCLPIGTPQFGSSNRHAFSEQRDSGSVDLVLYGDWPLRKRGWERSL